MNLISTLKLSLKNIKSNKTLFLPYILSSGLMLSIMYIMASLLSNRYIRERHLQLTFIMGFGILLTFIFVVIFIIYINSFINRKRSRELSLYNILGLEKKHIVKIVFMEQTIVYIMITVLGILGGYVFGKLSFLILSRLIKDVNASVTDYNFSSIAMWVVIVTIIFLFVVNLLISIKRISFSSPKELMLKSRRNEENLKFKKLFAVSGMIFLLTGYGMALMIKGFLSSIALFFVAVIIVIIGTYLFFVFSSTEILSGLKRNKGFYYRKRNFFWISGMITRIKSNGVSMATVTILCTCIIVTLSSTMTINSALKGKLDVDFPKEYKLNYYNQNLENPKVDELEKSLDAIIEKSSLKGMKVKDRSISISRSMLGYFKSNDDLVMVERYDKNFYNRENKMASIYIETLDSYNQEHKTDIKLGKNEILVSDFRGNDLHGLKKMKVFGREYNVGNYRFRYNGGDVFKGLNIVVENPQAMVTMIKDAYNGEKIDSLLIDVGMSWNVTGLGNREKEYMDNIRKNISENRISSGLVAESRTDSEKSMYSLNGGFIFMGIIVSLVFLVGIILVTYYKQVFEGYADRENIQIMKKIGLDENMIKKNSSSQMMWFFFTPLIIAPVNTLIASKMLYTLLTLFGLNSYMTFFRIIATVSVLVFIVYFALFRLTSRVYYKIVN